MEDLPKTLQRQYLLEDYRDDDDPRRQIDLKNHVGLFRPMAPGFGCPLMSFEETPVERCERMTNKYPPFTKDRYT